MILNDLHEGILVINMTSAVQRWSEIGQELRRMKVEGFERLAAITPNNVRFNKRKNATHGCLLSHAKAIQTAKANEWHSVMIFEDDALFENDFNDVAPFAAEFLKSNPWDMFYWGVNHFSPPIVINEHIHKVTQGMTTHAYAVHHGFYDRALEALKNFTAPVDVLFGNLHKANNVYSVKPRLIYQRPSYSAIQGGFADYTSLRDKR